MKKEKKRNEEKHPTLLRPDELGVDGLAAVDDDALACAETVFYCEEVCPCGDFAGRCPSLQRCLFHYLCPKRRIIYNAVVQGRKDSTGIEAVAYSSIWSNPQSHILGIGDHSPFAGTVLRELRTCMSACRADVQDGLDGRLDSVLLRNLYQGLQIDVDIVLILCSGIIYKNLNISDFRKFSANITKNMRIIIMLKRSSLSVDSDDPMSILEK